MSGVRIPDLDKDQLNKLLAEGQISKPNELQTMTAVVRMHDLTFGPFTDEQIAAMLLAFHKSSKEHYDNLVKIHRESEV